MTKLFRVLADSHIACDASNDDLHRDGGKRLEWSVPIVAIDHNAFFREQLVKHACKYLGADFLGFRVDPLREPWTPSTTTYTHELTIFLAHTYVD